MSPLVVVMTITLLLGLQPITTDPYPPTLPSIQREFATCATCSCRTKEHA